MKKSLILMSFLIIPSLMLTPVWAQTQTQTTLPGTAMSSDKTPVTSGEQQTANEQQEILRKVEDLQKQLDAMKEQGRTREKLSITVEEKAEQEKAVLTAVGREYTLMPKGKFELEYSLRYEYVSSSTFVSATTIEARSNHTIRNAIGFQYGLLNNLTANINAPFVYVYDKTGSTASRDASDLGDVTLGVDYQPFKSTGVWPTTTVTMGAILPTGRSPYKIDRATDLPTGNGLYGFTLGMNMSKPIDPAMAFAAVSAIYRLTRNDLDQYMDGLVLKKVEPGWSFNGAVGLAYAISYTLSMNTQFQYGYNMSTKYHFASDAVLSTPAYSTASFIIGTGWRVSPKTTLSFSVGIGLTKDDPDFFFMFRLPFSF